jgi:hypothetical protein
MKTIIKKFSLLAASLVCLLLSVQVHAEGISVEHASGRMKENVYLMDARIHYDLSDSVLEAVNHGIQLHFEVTIELRRERNWIWDDVVKTTRLDYILQYQPLSNDYLVTDKTSGTVQTLPALDDALQFLGTINNFPLMEQAEVSADVPYRCFIMSALKIPTLPLPLQPLAYISPKWRLSSQWYEWTIR